MYHTFVELSVFLFVRVFPDLLAIGKIIYESTTEYTFALLYPYVEFQSCVYI